MPNLYSVADTKSILCWGYNDHVVFHTTLRTRCPYSVEDTTSVVLRIPNPYSVEDTRTILCWRYSQSPYSVEDTRTTQCWWYKGHTVLRVQDPSIQCAWLHVPVLWCQQSCHGCWFCEGGLVSAWRDLTRVVFVWAWWIHGNVFRFFPVWTSGCCSRLPASLSHGVVRTSVFFSLSCKDISALSELWEHPVISRSCENTDDISELWEHRSSLGGVRTSVTWVVKISVISRSSEIVNSLTGFWEHQSSLGVVRNEWSP